MNHSREGSDREGFDQFKDDTALFYLLDV